MNNSLFDIKDSTINLCLYDNEVVCSIMSFKEIDHTGSWLLTDYDVLSSYDENICFDKLINFFNDNYNCTMLKKILDLRWGDISLYTNHGFILNNFLDPIPWAIFGGGLKKSKI